MEKYISILRDLIQFESVNDGEDEVAKYIANLFEGYDNVETEIIPSYPSRSNVIVKLKGSEKGKVFAISGHLDVVAAGEGWTYPPFEGVVEDGKMYGRGTADMKAGVAAGIYALLDLIEEKKDFPGEIWFIGTVGEEMGMQGALDLVEGGYLKDVDAIITPEPTKRDGENQGIFASKGSIMYAVHAEGKAAHSSMPEIGVNAITAIADFIQKVQKKFDEVTANKDFQNKELGSTLNVFSIMEGGIQINSVPDKAFVKGNIRTVPEFGSEQSIGILEKAIEENNRDESRAKLSLELIQVLDPAEAQKDNDLIRALKEAAFDKNVQIRPLIGTCELSRFIHISNDVQLLVYGPGLTKEAHVVDEYIELDEYVDTIRIFKDTAIKFLKM
ncbi:ArgE/DapE family deacylase [Mediannikoviicoccus vaginalis]|uniref:ArgE/DapE family deacylase n=1 Tax=Mediannikoviicoccus vaginalis TaxID=2899727 RepID=UPI001F31CAD8|nr:ArgE/DapE family deacylase [Mediannikoviicoccus vaginalis]